MARHRVTRRDCLRQLAAGAVAAGITTWRPPIASAGGSDRPSVTVLLEEPIRMAGGQPAIIEPAVHGHFVEHLGTVVYDGIWVGTDSKVAHIGGIRRALADSLRRLRPPVIRYPGGCFADAYHWRDGVGPRASRPRRFGRWGDVADSNQFGTHEFIRFCRLVGAEPYLAANLGSGSPDEFQQWIEYCNAPGSDPRTGTTLGAERDRQEVEIHGGKAEPFRVRYWGVGNESWDCGGKFTPEDYCTQYRRFTTWMPGYGVPLHPIAAGPNGNDIQWTRRFFTRWADGSKAPISGWAPHYYCGSSGTAAQFDVDQWYTLLGQANLMETLIRDQWAALAQFDPGHAIRLCVDEWGCWHPPDPAFPSPHMYAQTSTLRDALVAALTLDIFQRHADKVSLSCIAQLVNCLQSLFIAHEDRFVETTNYHVFDLYQPHKGATALTTRVEVSDVEYHRDGKPAKLFRVAGSASVRDQSATLTLVHTHAREPLELTLRLRGGRGRDFSGRVLTHEKLNAANTFEHPNEVQLREMALAGGGDELMLILPPASITRVQFKLG